MLHAPDHNTPAVGQWLLAMHHKADSFEQYLPTPELNVAGHMVLDFAVP